VWSFRSFLPLDRSTREEEAMHVTIVGLCAACIACSAPAVTPAREEAPSRWGHYSFELVDEAGQVLPAFWHHGRTYVLGTLGRRYFVRVRNDSGRRAEVVVSVDGRDVVDGGPASWAKRGYLIDPHGEVTIDGYRLNQESVAAFRFSSVPRSYAALEGDARDVGVVGVAVFPERQPPRIPVPYLPELGRRDQSAPAPREKSGAEAAPSLAPLPGAQADRRRGLGTELGEEHDSRVRMVSFQRASSSPEMVMSLRYDDRPGLMAAGVDVDHVRRRPDEALLRQEAEPFRESARFAPPPPGWRGSRSWPSGS
jgi:hypothetical protein